MLAREGVLRRQVAAARHPEDWPGYTVYRRHELVVWAQDLMREAGLPVPRDAEALELALLLEDQITPEMIPLPGALELVKALAGHNGRRLFIASGAPSFYSRQCLQGAGMLKYFERVLGPDVVDTLKTGPDYYRRAFDVTDLSPDECAVVDDSTGPLAWALQVGVKVVVAVGKAAKEPIAGAPAGERLIRASSLTEVADIVDHLGWPEG